LRLHPVSIGIGHLTQIQPPLRAVSVRLESEIALAFLRLTRLHRFSGLPEIGASDRRIITLKSAKAGIVAATKKNGQGLRFARKPDREVKTCCTISAFTAYPAGMS
jgi:hypothetical protein